MKKAKARAKKTARVAANLAWYFSQDINPFTSKPGRFFAGLVKDRAGKIYTRDTRGVRLVGHAG